MHIVAGPQQCARQVERVKTAVYCDRDLQADSTPSTGANCAS
jgi:hypothetical protein